MDKPSDFAYQSQITISSRTEPGVIMSIARWVRLKNRIRDCKRDINTWAGFAFTFLGIALSCAVQEFARYQTAKNANPPQDWSLSIWGWVAITAMLLTICCFFGTRGARRAESDSLESVLAEMDEIEATGTETKIAGA